MKSTFHLVSGPIGAGKTTFSQSLADTNQAVRFSIDEWMVTLFGEDMPAALDFPWIMARVQRCHHQIGATAIAAAERGVDVVLDLGFTSTAHRKAFADQAQSAGHDVRLYWLDIPIDIRWKRVEERNVRRGPTHAFGITPEMFAFMEGSYEPPDVEEMQDLNGVRVRLL